MVPHGTWANKAEKLMKDPSYYHKIAKLPRNDRKKEYLKLVKKNLSKLKDIKVPTDIEKVYKDKHTVVRKPLKNKIYIGLKGASLECIEKCDIKQFHGFPDGITFE